MALNYMSSKRQTEKRVILSIIPGISGSALQLISSGAIFGPRTTDSFADYASLVASTARTVEEAFLVFARGKVQVIRKALEDPSSVANAYSNALRNLSKLDTIADVVVASVALYPIINPEIFQHLVRTARHRLNPGSLSAGGVADVLHPDSLVMQNEFRLLAAVGKGWKTFTTGLHIALPNELSEENISLLEMAAELSLPMLEALCHAVPKFYTPRDVVKTEDDRNRCLELIRSFYGDLGIPVDGMDEEALIELAKKFPINAVEHLNALQEDDAMVRFVQPGLSTVSNVVRSLLARVHEVFPRLYDELTIAEKTEEVFVKAVIMGKYLINGGMDSRTLMYRVLSTGLAVVKEWTPAKGVGELFEHMNSSDLYTVLHGWVVYSKLDVATLPYRAHEARNIPLQINPYAKLQCVTTSALCQELFTRFETLRRKVPDLLVKIARLRTFYPELRLDNVDHWSYPGVIGLEPLLGQPVKYLEYGDVPVAVALRFQQALSLPNWPGLERALEARFIEDLQQELRLIDNYSTHIAPFMDAVARRCEQVCSWKCLHIRDELIHVPAEFFLLGYEPEVLADTFLLEGTFL